MKEMEFLSCYSLTDCNGKLQFVILSRRNPCFYESAVQVFWKHCREKGRNCSWQCFLPVWRTFCGFQQIWNCRLQSLQVWKSLKFVVWSRVKDTTITTYNDSEEEGFWENIVGKKILITGIFSFSVKNQNDWQIFNTLPNVNIIWLVQFLSLCRRQNKYESKTIFFKGGKKRSWERRKYCKVTSIFSFYCNDFNPFQNKFHIFNNIFVIFCKCFQTGTVWNVVGLVKS